MDNRYFRNIISFIIFVFIGEYNHTIDPKKRIAVPAKFRQLLGSVAIITRGLDNCLFLYPKNEWNSLAEKLSKLPIGQQDARGFARLMLAGAVEVELDSLGRILLPDYLKKYAGLDKKVILAGLYNRIEIWDENNWEKYKENAEQEVGGLAEKMGQLGI